MGSVAYPCNVTPLELPKYMFPSVFWLRYAPMSRTHLLCRLIKTQTWRCTSPPPPPHPSKQMLLPASIKPGLLTVEKRVPIFIWNVSMTKNPSLGENPPTNKVVFLKE
jgi:hypothetical protein